MSNLTYIGIEYTDRLHQKIRPNYPKCDLTTLPFAKDTFDAVICQHVLEHIHQDQKAMSELYRVLKPGGWAAISSPIRWDQLTYEDPNITDPVERKRAFGEEAHVRFYGRDLSHRLQETGFHVQLDLGKNLKQTDIKRFGLLNNEDIFFCRKF